MFKILLLTLTLCAFAGCDTSGMQAPCELQPLSTDAPASCNFELPAGTVCAAVEIYADGEPLSPDAYSVVCDAGIVHVPACGSRTIAICKVDSVPQGK